MHLVGYFHDYVTIHEFMNAKNISFVLMGVPLPTTCRSSAAPVWIWDFAFVLSWKKLKLFGLMVYCCRFSSQPFYKIPRNVTVFWYEANPFPSIFLILQAFILRLSNELPWRDIPETSNTFIHIFSLLQFYFHFVSIPLSLSLSFSPQQQSKSYFPLPPTPTSFLVLWHDLFLLFIRFQLVLYLSFFFLIIQILAKFCLMLHESHQNQCFIRAVITSMLCNQFLCFVTHVCMDLYK